MEVSSAAEPVCTDSVILGAFPSLAGVRRAADFGCGSGVISLILSARSRTAGICMVEIDPAAAALARRNVELNNLNDRLHVLQRDLRELREAEVGKFQLIVTNPPYFVPGHGGAPAEGRRVAREERACTLAEIAEAAAKLLGDGGRLALVYPPERLAEAMVTLSGHGLEPKRLRLAAAGVEAPPFAALIECRRGGKPGLRVEPELILKTPGGEDTPEAREIYHL